MDLDELGWKPFFQSQQRSESAHVPGRVTRQEREIRRVEARKDDHARREEKAKVKQFGKMYKDVVQRKRDRWKSCSHGSGGARAASIGSRR